MAQDIKQCRHSYPIADPLGSSLMQYIYKYNYSIKEFQHNKTSQWLRLSKIRTNASENAASMSGPACSRCPDKRPPAFALGGSLPPLARGKVFDADDGWPELWLVLLPEPTRDISTNRHVSIWVQSSNCVTRNYGNYPYGNFVGNAPVGNIITLNT